LITEIPTERTTAFTDLLLAALSLAAIAALRPLAARERWKVTIWSWVFALLALGATLGALAHGLDLAASTRTLLWQPLFLALGALVGLFVVAAVYDLRGRKPALRLLPLMLGLALAFYALTRLFAGAFRVFLVYEAAAMILALVIYLVLARAGRPGSFVIAAAIVLNLVAGAIQESESLMVTWLWRFDHNGLFHLAQMVAIVVLVVGLRISLRRPPPRLPGTGA